MIFLTVTLDSGFGTIQTPGPFHWGTFLAGVLEWSASNGATTLFTRFEVFAVGVFMVEEDALVC